MTCAAAYPITETALFETGGFTTEEKTAFGKFIAAKRKAQGLTQAELAQRLYVTESAVSKWERGVSYPDITLVGAICSALTISEHELITASDDVHQRQLELQARKYRRLRKGYIWAWNGIYITALLTCLICNLAINHALTWFFIAVASCLTAFSLTSVPVMAARRKGLAALGTFFVTLNLLLLTCCLYTGGRWFFVSLTAVAFAFSVVFTPLILRNVVLPGAFCRHKALLSMGADTLLLFLLLTAVSVYQGQLASLLYPVGTLTLYLLALPWAFLLIIRYIPLGGRFRAALCLTAGGLYLLTVNGVSDAITERLPFTMPAIDLSNWSAAYINGNVILLTTLACLAAALLFACAGIPASVRQYRLAQARAIRAIMKNDRKEDRHEA